MTENLAIWNDPKFESQRHMFTPKRIREIIMIGRKHGLKIVARRVFYNGFFTLLFPHDMYASDYITAMKTLKNMIDMDCACTECWAKKQHNDKYMIG